MIIGANQNYKYNGWSKMLVPGLKTYLVNKLMSDFFFHIVFCKDAQITFIPTVRGTCMHDHIVKRITSAHWQYKFQRDFQQVIMIARLF